jgi:hypothetical protein
MQQKGLEKLGPKTPAVALCSANHSAVAGVASFTWRR